MHDPWGILSAFGTDGTMAGLSCVAKAAGILAGAWLVALALSRRAAATRHLVWFLGLAGALAVLPLEYALPRWGVPVLPPTEEVKPALASSPVPEAQPADSPAVTELRIVPSESLALSHSPRALPSEPNTAKVPLLAWPLAIWGIGTLAVLAWGAAGWAAMWWLGRNAKRVTDPLWVEAAREAAAQLRTRSVVTLLRGGAAAMPLTWGVLRPMLLLPDEADVWPVERRRAVLLHELAHVRRRDCLTQWLGLAACAAYWFNPLAWWAASRLRCEREQACDDLVLEAGEWPSDYAAQLLDVARSLRPARPMAPGVMAMARPSGLERRLLAILDAHRNRRSPTRWLVVSCLAAVLAIAATLATLRLVAKEPPRKVVSGQVVGSDGKPLEGADVVVIASRYQWRYSDSKDQLLGRGRSDEQGRFRVELSGRPESERGQGHSRGHGARIRLRSQGACRTECRDRRAYCGWIPNSRLKSGSSTLKARRSPARRSRLPGPIRQRAAPAWLLISQSASFCPCSLRNGRATRTAGSRCWATGRIKRSLSTVSAPGFGKQVSDIAIKPGMGTTALTLGRAHIVEGQVTLGKSGPPAAGARIETRSMSERHGIGMTVGNDEVTTDKDGRYRIDAAPGASIVLMAIPPRAGADGYLLRGHLVVPGDSITSHVDFALPKGVLVRGRVTEAGTGAGQSPGRSSIIRPINGTIHSSSRVTRSYSIRMINKWSPRPTARSAWASCRGPVICS